MVLLRHDMVGRLLIAVVWCKDIRGGGGGGDHIGIRRIGSPIIEAEEMGGGGLLDMSCVRGAGGCYVSAGAVDGVSLPSGPHE